MPELRRHREQSAPSALAADRLQIRDRIAVALESVPLTFDERQHKTDRKSSKRAGLSWAQFFWDVLAKKDGFLDEFPRDESLFQHINQGRPSAWVLVDIADGLDVSMDDLAPTRAVDSPEYRAARLALAPRGLRSKQRATLWRLVRTVCETYRAARLADEKSGDEALSEAYVSAVEKVSRDAREQALSAYSTTGSLERNARSLA